jgi:hypothetical protein
MEEKKERCPNDICPRCGHYCDCVEGDISVRCECICSGEPDEEREPTIPISEMFEFARWFHEKEFMFNDISNRWIDISDFEGPEPSYTWIDLWNKYQEYKQKVKQETNDKV